MKENEVIESNKMIAEFMGKPYDYLICDACGKINPELDDPESGSRITKCCPRSIGNYGKTLRPDNASIETFKYHTSWDWLMPVVEKIENLGYEVSFFKSWATIADNEFKSPFKEIIINGTNRLESIYKAVTDFIKWYSLQSPTTDK